MMAEALEINSEDLDMIKRDITCSECHEQFTIICSPGKCVSCCPFCLSLFEDEFGNCLLKTTQTHVYEQEQSIRVSTDYNRIKYTPGMYWARGVVPFMPPERWTMLRVIEQCWTPESRKDHCLWHYLDMSGGSEVDRGEWILIPDPNTTLDVK